MKDFQIRIKAFCAEHELNAPPEHRVLDITSELGEVSKELLKLSDYGAKPTPRIASNELKSELGDLLFSIIVLANIYDTDLEESLNTAIKKYERRLRKGSAGSECE